MFQFPAFFPFLGNLFCFWPSCMFLMLHNADFPCRALREEFYRAYITRASSGASDNTPLIERTLALKHEQAQLLGYPNYAEVSLASKVLFLQPSTHHSLPPIQPNRQGQTSNTRAGKALLSLLNPQESSCTI